MSLANIIKVKLGLVSDPQVTYPSVGATETTEIVSTSYSIDDFLKEYKRVSLVRQCINLLAYYTTRRSFTTEIKPIVGREEDYLEIKNKIDKINHNVNLDEKLRIAIIKMKVTGCSAFEIVKDTTGETARLLPLKSADLELQIDENWNLEKFKYTAGTSIDYEPEDVLYFVNNALEADLVGLSDVEPIMTAIETKRALEHDLRACARQYWAPLQLFEMDTSGIRPDKVDNALKDFADSLKPGKSIVHNQSLKSKTVTLHPNIGDLTIALAKADEEIIGNFNIPKALLAREKTMNRATLEYSLRALYEGPIEGLQMYLKREVENQFYDRIVTSNGLEGKVKILHVWNPLTYADFRDLATVVASLFKVGIIDKQKAYEILHWKEEIQSERTIKPEVTPSVDDETSRSRT